MLPGLEGLRSLEEEEDGEEGECPDTRKVFFWLEISWCLTFGTDFMGAAMSESITSGIQVDVFLASPVGMQPDAEARSEAWSEAGGVSPDMQGV